MLGMIGSLIAGRAAKAGVALVTGLLTTGGAAGVANDWQNVIPNVPIVGEYSIVGYIIIGAIGGLANWAAVYFKSNPGYVPPRSEGGLY